MPDPVRMLWIDVEATGILVEDTMPTVLEAAWTVTDVTGAQLTPMRQRFTILPAAQDARWAPVYAPVRQGDGVIAWAGERGLVANYPSDPVKHMHAANGLALEWAEFADREQAGTLETARVRRRAAAFGDTTTPLVSDWEVFDALISADLMIDGWEELERGQIVLAGGGVSHYEDRFLRAQCPNAFAAPRMHYSTGADVSTVLRTLGARTNGRISTDDYLCRADGVLEWVRVAEAGGNLPADLEGWDTLELGTGATFAAADRDVAGWAAAQKDIHRAAPGIARALMAYRVLPYFLRERLETWADAG